MSFRTVAGLACAAAVVLAPAAHAGPASFCVLPFGTAVPAGLQHWRCVGATNPPPGCTQVAVLNPNTRYPVAGVEICGLV